MRHPPITAPLLWHCWLADWCLGSLAALWFWQAAFCLVLVLLFAFASRPVSLFHITIRLGLGLALFFLALTITKADLEDPPVSHEAAPLAASKITRIDSRSGHDQQTGNRPRKQVNDYRSGHERMALVADTSVPEADKKKGKKTRTRVCGTASQIQSLPDQRLRILLESPRLYTIPQAKTAQPDRNRHENIHQIKTHPDPSADDDQAENQTLPGLIAWTWEKPGFYPLAGQMICVSKEPKPLSGFANFDLQEWNTGLKLSGVRWRLWNRGDDGSPALADANTKNDVDAKPDLASKMARIRKSLVDRVAYLAGLPPLHAIRQISMPDLAPKQRPETYLPATHRSGAVAGVDSVAKMVNRDNGGKGDLSENMILRQADGHAFESKIQHHGPDQAKAILPALLFGERFWLSSQTVKQFADASLAHSLALSGQHLAIAWLAAAFMVAGLGRAWPNLYLSIPRQVITMLMACPLAAIYLWLGNAPWSLIRSGAMLAVLAVCISLRRSHSLNDILAIAMVCILLVSPSAILGTGLQLSVLCVTVIAVCLPWLKRLHGRLRGPSGWQCFSRLAFACLSILGISLAIQIFLLPLNLLLFGNPGFYFAINLVWLPMIALWLLPLAFAGLLLACPGLIPASSWPGLSALANCCDFASGICLQLASLPAELLLSLLSWLEAPGLLSAPAIMRPHWTALPAFALLMLAMANLTAYRSHSRGRWIQMPGRVGSARILLGLAIALLAIGPLCRFYLRLDQSLSETISLDVLDVGLGQALVLRCPGGQRILVDAGGSSSTRFDPGQAIVAPALLANQGPQLAAIINSHPDMDHAGGIFYLNESFRNGHLFHNGRQAEGKRAKDWSRLLDQPGAKSLASGDRIILDNDQLLLEILHPPRETQVGKWTDNDASLLLRLVRNGKGLALLTGDADHAALRYLLAMNREHGLDLSAEIMVAPHHGSDKNFVPDFYRAVKPSLVVASCGANNRYNYPGKRLSAWLEQQGITLLDTGRNGQIRISWSGDGKMETEWARRK